MHRLSFPTKVSHNYVEIGVAKMPTPAQFFRYCPSETAASGATDAPSFGSYVASGSQAALQASLDAYLGLDGRAAEASQLHLGSYLVDPGSQPLPGLSDDMALSYGALGSAPPLGLEGYLDLHAALYLSLADATSGERPASAGSIALLRHVAPGTRVVVQLHGDTVTQLECVVTAVSASGATLSGPLPDAEVIVTAVFMSDAERAVAVIAFRQFGRFPSPAVAADEATFNPGLYLLLYGEMYPDVRGMTASQMYDDYSGHPGRVGSVLDLRKMLDAPAITNLSVDDLLSLEPGAALRIDDVLVRRIATLADVVSGASDASSDIALVTASAARQMVALAIQDIQLNAVSDRVTASISITLTGALSVTQDSVVVDVPAIMGSVTAIDVRTDGLDAAYVRTDAVSSSRSDLGDARATGLDAFSVTASTAALGSLTVTGDAEVSGVLSASAGLSAGPSDLASLRTGDAVVASLRADDARLASLDVAGDVTCSTLAAAGQVSAPAVSALALTAGSSLTVGSSLAVDGSVAVLRVPLQSEAVRATSVDSDTVRAGHVDAATLTAASADVTTLAASTLDCTQLSVSQIVNGLRVIGATDVEALSCTSFSTGEIRADTALYRAVTVTSTADVAQLTVRGSASVERGLAAYRLSTVQLDVSGPGVVTTLAVTGSATLNSGFVVTDLGVAGNVVVAGTHDAGPTRIRGNLTLMGDISTQRAIVDGDIYSEHGGLKLTRGSADVYGDLSLGGGATVGGALVVRGGASLGSDARVSGAVLATGDVTGANAHFVGFLRAGDAELSAVDCGPLRCDTAVVAAALSVGGDARIDGKLSTEGDARLRGGVTAQYLSTVGDVVVGQDASVNRRLDVGANATVGGDVAVGGSVNAEGDVTCEAVLAQSTVSASDFAASGDATVGGGVFARGTIEAGGNLECGGDLLVIGDASVERLTTAADAVVAGSIAVAGDADVEGAVRAGGDLDVSGAVDVEGDLTVQSDVLAYGDLRVEGALAAHDVSAASVSADVVTSGALTAGSLAASAVGVTVDRGLQCGSLQVQTATELRGPLALSSTVDFGLEPTIFRAQVSAPFLAADAVTTQEVHVRRIVIGAAADSTIGTFGDPSPSAMQARITALESQVATLVARLALLP